MISRTAALAVFSAIVASAPANATVTISTAATQNMTCSGGVCAPTAMEAVLNVGDLETLLASANATVTTSGSGAQANNIRVAAPLTWSNTSALTLQAYETIEVDRLISVAGEGSLYLDTQLGRLVKFDKSGRITFANLSSTLAVGATYFTLVGDIATLATDIANNQTYPGGNYALANDYDASADGTYAASPIPDYEVGTILGLGNTIKNLSINNPTANALVGLFAFIGQTEYPAVISLKLSHATITGADGASVGGIAGVSDGSISDVSVSGTISGGATSYVGGIVGSGAIASSHANARVKGTAKAVVGGIAGSGGIWGSYSNGKVTVGKNGVAGGLIGEGQAQQSFASGAVSGTYGSYVGGLIGNGTGYESYATSSVTGGDNSYVGGFAGLASYDGEDIESYSTGKVTGGNGSYVGGFFGELVTGYVSNAYWDTETSDTQQGVGHGNSTGITGLTTKQFQSGLPPGFEKKYWRERSDINGGFPYLKLNSPPM
jgi:hypothetical protein